jgi:hypothetical protein
MLVRIIFWVVGSDLAESEDQFMRLAFTLLTISGIGMLPVLAQEGAKPAPVLSIQREAIKEGRGAAHEKVETEWAAAFRKANFPAHYIAMSTMSGTGEVWFISPMASFAAQEEADKAEEKEPVKSMLAMMDARDGELRSGTHTIWAVYRPDLSYRPDKFKPAKARYVMASSMRVRLGHEEDFAEGAKVYFGAHEKANIDECTLGYEIVAGAPAGSYLFFTLMESLKMLDEEPAHMQAIQQAMGPEAFSKFMKGAGDVFVSIEDTLLQVRPGMSYAPQDLIDADPAFWKPKPAAKPAAPPEKKASQ